MKKITAVLLMLLLALPAGAETLSFQVTDTLSINAETPSVPDALPSVVMRYHQFDPDQLQQLFMKTTDARTDYKDGDVTLGDESGSKEYMLIEPGRFTYYSEYYATYLDALMNFGNEMNDFSNLFPSDLELEGISKSEAVENARAILTGMGLRLLPGEQVYTIEQNTFAEFKSLLSESEWQVYLSKRYLEPFDPAHEGYFILFAQALVF